MLERNLVAEEKRFVRGHRLSDLGDERLALQAPELPHQFSQAVETGVVRDRQQSALDQILLVGRQRETGTLLQELAQVVIVGGRHERLPANMFVSLVAI